MLVLSEYLSVVVTENSFWSFSRFHFLINFFYVLCTHINFHKTGKFQSLFLDSSSVRRRVPGGGSSVKEQGGIHRLHNRDDEDDDNNTWNGNSTQQM